MKNRLLCTIGLAIALAAPLASQAAIAISVNIAPPPLPVYVQPLIPAAGYIWTPGYWGWGSAGYFWHGGYWGPHIGFYGGVNYGYGYTGYGYHGGYWRDGVFNYNRSVNNVNIAIVHNVYNERVVERNVSHVSFNGGRGGIAARPTPEQRELRQEHHIAPTPSQRQHEQVAMHTPEQRAAFNHGAPAMAAMERPEAGRAAPGRSEAQREERGMPQGRPEAPREQRAAAPHEAGPRGGGERHGGGGNRDRDRDR